MCHSSKIEKSAQSLHPTVLPTAQSSNIVGTSHGPQKSGTNIKAVSDKRKLHFNAMTLLVPSYAQIYTIQYSMFHCKLWLHIVYSTVRVK